jgi:hypothetical protein
MKTVETFNGHCNLVKETSECIEAVLVVDALGTYSTSQLVCRCVLEVLKCVRIPPPCAKRTGRSWLALQGDCLRCTKEDTPLQPVSACW